MSPADGLGELRKTGTRQDAREPRNVCWKEGGCPAGRAPAQQACGLLLPLSHGESACRERLLSAVL